MKHNVFQSCSEFSYNILTPNELRSLMGLPPILEQIPKKTNCPNCGAPISKDGVCEYCGTYVNRKG